MDLVPRPLVGKFARVAPLPVVDVEARGAGAVALGVEWRIGGDEVHRLRVHASEHVEVVKFVDGAVWEILLGHPGPMLSGEAVVRVWRLGILCFDVQSRFMIRHAMFGIPWLWDEFFSQFWPTSPGW